MKKILTLTAVALAACGAAHAQSIVTLYGIVDVNVSNYAAGGKTGVGNKTVMNDGTVNGLHGSRLGFKAVEDLGNGVTAATILEMGMLTDSGASAQGGLAFGRQAYLSLSSPRMGELRLGRQYTLGDTVLFINNPFNNAMMLNPGQGVTNMGKSLSVWVDAPRANNVVQYTTPRWGGVALSTQLAPGEGTADRFHAVKADVMAGGLTAALSYDWLRAKDGSGNYNKSLSFGGNYNFGVVKVLGEVQVNKDMKAGATNGVLVGNTVTGDTTFAATKSNVYTLGVEFPVSTAVTLGTNYTLAKYEDNASHSDKLGKFAVGARYGLSKNTFIYGSGSIATSGLKEYISEKRVVQVGLRKMF